MFALLRTEPDAPKHEGISYILIDMEQPGITVRPIMQINGGTEFCEVFLDNVRAPADRLVGPRAIRRAEARLPNVRSLWFGPEAAHEILREVDAVRSKALREIDRFLEGVSRT